jgi:hypothetical protein
MIDPLTSVAFAIHSNKGAYALLLGSGLSRAAGIPTGWEIVLDLVRKVARLEGEDAEPDPAVWYRDRFGQDPDYGRLLSQLARSPAERNKILRAYFEPTSEEREQGLKVPTTAHRAIADLAARGYIRVILTTNFDRLLERALEEAGVVPTVISTSDAARGALPLVHTPCMVVKVHGDYLDTRIKNTPAELERYDRQINQLLDRLIDEFGLIIVGWSAEWDTGLRSAIERAPGRRFTTFWAIRNDVSETARRLMELRQAVPLKIADADSFFRSLQEKVSALEEYARPHPLSSKLAVATVKSYLADDRFRIRLHDLVLQETERAFAELTEEHFPVQTGSVSPEDLARRLSQYEAYVEVIQSMLATGCYWGEAKHAGLWARSLEWIANPPGGGSGIVLWLHLRRYPALLLQYTAGVACIAGSKYETLRTLLFEPKIRENSEKVALIFAVYPGSVLETQAGQLLPGMERRYTPVSDYLHGRLREPLRQVVPEDPLYERAFDRFEYLLGLIYADAEEQARIAAHAQDGERVWGPVGRFGWKARHGFEHSVAKEIEEEVDQLGGNWPPVRAGLFGGSIDRARSIKTRFDAWFRNLSWFF